MASADPESVLIGQEASRFHHLLIVGKGLSHAHKDDVADAIAGQARNGEDLIDDLTRCEIAYQSTESGGAKGAPDAAACLRRDARRPTRTLRDHDRFDRRAVV